MQEETVKTLNYSSYDVRFRWRSESSCHISPIRWENSSPMKRMPAPRWDGDRRAAWSAWTGGGGRHPANKWGRGIVLSGRKPGSTPAATGPSVDLWSTNRTHLSWFCSADHARGLWGPGSGLQWGFIWVYWCPPGQIRGRGEVEALENREGVAWIHRG